MGLETGVTYIEDLVDTNPVGATDNVDEGDDHIRNIKTAVQGSFPNLGAAAVTATAAELNYTDVTAAGTAQASKAVVLDASKDVAGLNVVTAASFVGPLTGNASTATSATAAASITGNLTGDVTSTGMSTSLAASTVGSKTASLAVNAVGTYAFCYQTTGTYAAGATIAGSLLTYAGISLISLPNSGSPTGTWRCMGYVTINTATLWLKIA